MFKTLFFLILSIVGICDTVLSQQLSHQVVVPLAGLASDTKISYSQTVGETAVELVGCSQYLFTQGFQQPGIKNINERPPAGTGVKVYPNPFSDYIIVELFGQKAKTFRIDMINITGTTVLSVRKAFSDQFWYREQQNVEDLVRGFYLIRIISEDGMINRTFKVEKI